MILAISAGGKTLLKVHLVLANRDRRGDRFAVDKSPFVIGRREECQLRLESGKVSRRHCQIMQDGDRVTIEDLGSRNGTVINDRRIESGQPCRLWHRDKIQVGPFVFRISVRDAQTNRSIEAPQPIPSDETDPVIEADPSKTLQAFELMNELDAMATQLEFTVQKAKSSWHQLDSDSKIAKRDDGQPQPPPTSQSTAADETHETEMLTTIAELPGFKTKQSASDPKTKQGTSTKDDDSEPQELKKGPQPIPEHLRPKKPVDSTDAAQQALRRFFNP